MKSATEASIGATGPSGHQREQFAIFSAKLFAKMSAAAARSIDAAERAEIAREGLGFFSARTSPVQVRIGSRHSHDEAVTVVESVMPDRPFIVDSVCEYLHRMDLEIKLLLHPLISVKRARSGEIVSIESGKSDESRESFVHIELEPAIREESATALVNELTKRLGHVYNATGDFAAMTSAALTVCDELAAPRELIEVRDFLRWLVQEGFVFLGYQRYQQTAEDGQRLTRLEAGTGLGVLHEEDSENPFPPLPVEPLNAQLAELVAGSALFVSKTRAESDVHRLSRMDEIVVRRTDARGRLSGFHRFVGLFTSKAYAEEAQHVPILRAKLKEVIEAEGALPGSHDFKELVTTFNSLPKEELFRATVPQLRNELATIIQPDGPDVRVCVQRDELRGMVVVLVVLPRERYSAEVRAGIEQAIARQAAGALIFDHLAIGQTYDARLCFWYESGAKVAEDELAHEVARIARSWEDRLEDEIVRLYGEARGLELFSRYRHAFSEDYKSSTSVERAVADIDLIEKLGEGGDAVEISAPQFGVNASELRIFDLNEPLILSELMPRLQNFGMRVLSEDAHSIRLDRDGRPQNLFVQVFLIQDAAGKPIPAEDASRIARAISAVKKGLAESDPLNALAISARMDWREVSLMRALLASAFQMKLAPARPALRRPFLQHPELARDLFEVFKARLDPQSADEASASQLREKYVADLGAVDNIADDRVARAVFSMVDAAVRTNYFAPLNNPDPYLAVKFESGKIQGLTGVAPLYEIHVNSPRMEGCHLRSAKIARGGIRASDRPDDYRTEILALMKTQTVKNAIIVPMGAKGGFIVKTTSSPSREETVTAYRTLINAMLDLTDNLVEGRQVHPEHVRVPDDDGPYLVVAADKGTASFSDIANDIAEQRGFWLGDAFASGGKYGYAHKELGITARGAWESARRHLREMGRDIEHGAPVTTVGIGDMSGDVFGNGMLQSDNLKLIAAFNHKHIFLDPDPAPKASFRERKRLFELPNSQWSDYEQKLISKGGGVFLRGQKSISLSPEVRAALKIDASALDGESLISAILRADVEMLYNGGIGTYVRSASETDAEVGDHANDACRITATELRSNIVVEGGNLGFTQRARIEYALAGGRINTDAIDNSAGVDMSDHEVNLKILMQPARLRGELNFEERNRALQEATAEVVDLVLSDNRDQVLLLSLEQLRSRNQLTIFRDHMTDVEQRGLLRRQEESLPTREALLQRRSKYPGLTRPELSIVTAYTKIDLTHRLEDGSKLLDDSYLTSKFLMPYFPQSIWRQFASEIPVHALRREIVATQVVNEMVDLMGSTFVFQVSRDRTASAEQAVRGWIIANDLLGLTERAEQLKAIKQLEVGAEMTSFMALERAGVSATRWLLENSDGTAESLASIIENLKPGLTKLLGTFETHLKGAERERFERIYRELRTSGQIGETAHELSRLVLSDHLLNVLRLHHKTGSDLELAAEAYFQLSELVDFAALETALDSVASDDRWERRAAHQLGVDLRHARLQIATSVLELCRGHDSAAALKQWQDSRPQKFDEMRTLVNEIRAMPAITIAALEVAVRAVSGLAA